MTKANRSHSRRAFLGAAGFAAGALALSSRSYGRVIGANDRIRVGMIGNGGMAGNHLGTLLYLQGEGDCEIVAVTDVYRTRAKGFQDKIAEAGGKADIEQDYKSLLARDDIDKVVIATPEHTHAYLALAAVDAGKHVYCEKPITRHIDDGFRVLKKVNESKIQFQVGIQGMADDSYSSAYQAIREGKLGSLVSAQIDYVRNYTTAGPWREAKLNEKKPEDLDWDSWTNPLARRPWNAHHYFEWRCYKDYSGGISADLFVHRLARLVRACGLGYPDRVTGMGGIYTWPDGRDLPDSMEMLAEYPAMEGITNGMTVHLLGTMANNYGNDHCIRGTKATLRFTPTGWEIIPVGKKDPTETHKKTGGENTVPHHENHHAAIRTGAPLNCPVDLALKTLVGVEMANLSWERHRMAVWDHERNRVRYL